MVKKDCSTINWPRRRRSWSPDSSKVATAFEVSIGIYDAANKAPTQARIALREQLLTASASFDEKSTGKKKEPANNSNVRRRLRRSASFIQPGSAAEWPAPEKLYVETAYVALRSELIKTFARWHLLSLSPKPPYSSASLKRWTRSPQAVVSSLSGISRVTGHIQPEHQTDHPESDRYHGRHHQPEFPKLPNALCHPGWMK